MQLSTEQRSSQNRFDDLNEKLRSCERERNDIRTRLAAELRSYQLGREEHNQELIQHSRGQEQET
jgi:hypothetical protein